MHTSHHLKKKGIVNSVFVSFQFQVCPVTRLLIEALRPMLRVTSDNLLELNDG